MSDSITTKEAFKLGFVHRCVEQGLSKEQTLQLMEKAALSLTDLWNAALHTASEPGATHQGLTHTPGPVQVPPQQHSHTDLDLNSKRLGGLATLLAVGVPTIAGGAAGYLTRKLKGSRLDEEDVRKQELIDEYNSLSNKAKNSQSASLGL